MRFHLQLYFFVNNTYKKIHISKKIYNYYKNKVNYFRTKTDSILKASHFCSIIFKNSSAILFFFHSKLPKNNLFLQNFINLLKLNL